MQRSDTRILTTHVGSLPRPNNLLDMMKVRIQGGPDVPGANDDAFRARVKSAVSDIVHQQLQNGIDIPSDGEQGKFGFFSYVTDRLSGFEPRADRRFEGFRAEVNSFPEYYADYFGRAMTGGSILPIVPMECTGPVVYRGHEAVQRDIANLKEAVDGKMPADVFMPSIAPSGVGSNQFYKTRQEYLAAVGEAMRQEYLAIVDAGFILQIDDPFLSESYSEPGQTVQDWRMGAQSWIEALNHAVRGIPPEKIRFHTCYDINEGPRIHDAPMSEIAPLLLKINAGAYSFEAANARHEHEYHVWENLKLPEGKILIPGVITHAGNIVEHPELIAERIIRFAERVGRENVIAGTDCGFSSQATYRPEVHPTVMWAKFRAMEEGAAIATKKLWS